MTDFDDERVRHTGREAARHDHERGQRKPSSRHWAPAYREGYEEELARLENAHHQRGGIDPGALQERINDQIDEMGDLLDAEAGAIARRAALKILTLDSGTDDALTAEGIAEIIEAELRSTFGTPREGDVIVRLQYEEAVQTVTAVVEAQTGNRANGELETLAEIKRKFLLAIGLL